MSQEELQLEVESLRKRRIKVQDLPLDQLRKKLDDEPRNPADFILPNSIGPDLLSAVLSRELPKYVRNGEVRFDFDVTPVVINAQGGYATIPHKLGIVPKVVLPILNTGAFQVNTTADSYTNTTFRLGAYRTDGPNVGSTNVAWLALGVEGEN
jgi:hypothetical protein